MIDAGFEILNQRGTPMFFSDTFANRPAAGIVGRIFISTDTNEIYRDTGSGWNLLGGGGGTIGGSIIAGQVAFGTASNTIGGSNALQWDNTNERLGVGVGVPTSQLHLFGNAPVINSSTNVSNQFHGLELSLGTSLDAFFKQRPDTGELRISNGRTTIWNGFITFYTDTTEKMRITPLGRLLLNTTTDTGEILQVNGTSSFLGNITLSLNQNAATGYTIINSTSGTAANSFLKLQTTNASTYGEFAKLSALYTTYKIFVGNDLAIYNSNTSGDIAILNDFATGNIKFAAGGSTTAQMTLLNNGNLGLGTTSPANELTILANKVGTLAFSISNINTSTSGATAITIGQSVNSSPFNALFIANYGSGFTPSGALLPNSNTITSGIGSTNGLSIIADANSSPLRFFTRNAAGSQSEKLRIFGNTGNILIQDGATYTDSGERLQVTGTAKITGASSFGGNMTLSLNQDNITQLNISNTTPATSSRAAIRFDSDTNSGISILQKTSTGYTTYKIITGKDFGIYNATGGDIAILNDFASGNIKFAAGGSSTAQMTLHNTGNLLIGSTSNTGERLQITGTQLNTDTRTYSTGSINSLVVSKNLTIPSGATIPSGGQSITSINASGTITFQGSLTIPNNAVFSNSAAISIYSIPNTATTITSTQATGTRTIAQNIVQNQFSGTNSATFTHVSSTQILGYYNNNTGSITPIIDNAYQLFINSISDYGHTFTFTNRWGIYQEGTNDRNYLAGNLLVGSNIDGGEKLQITGTAIIYSKLSMGGGTTSNAQINLASSTAPTSPNNGDIWFDGTDLFMRIGGVTKTFTII